MLWEAWRMKPNEGEETQREVEEELARLVRLQCREGRGTMITSTAQERILTKSEHRTAGAGGSQQPGGGEYQQ